ncbi:MAG: transketolase [Hyphomonadaceae bacterium]|nr:transketolase [Clostridia bacterium]
MNSLELAWRIKRHGVEMTYLSGGSHIGSILSMADILAVLYEDILNFDNTNPKMDSRDRFILSKGHAGAGVYAALAEKGFFEVQALKTHYANGSKLSGHVSHKGIPGVELSTGSLGHGISVGVGMALVAKKDDKKHRVFVVMGDGECDEGSVWEAAMFANHFKLDNLVAIVDHNKMQSIDFCENTMSLAPFAEKWQAFGWQVKEIDGHNHEELKNALAVSEGKPSKPTIIIANTIKGKGISFMENNILWHYRAPQGEEYTAAVKELEAQKP